MMVIVHPDEWSKIFLPYYRDGTMVSNLADYIVPVMVVSPQPNEIIE